MFRLGSQLPRNTFLQRLIQQQWRSQKIVWVGLFVVVLILVLASASSSLESLTVRVDRWIAVQYLNGDVTLLQGGKSRVARLGDRLQAVGDGIRTGANSTATLEIDTQIGFVEVAEQTELSVQTLEIAPTQGHITRLRISQGRASLKLRSFNNPDSRLEIETPAGISGVRGTEFGLNVFPTGKTGVATLEGRVVTAAQGQAVPVSGGYQNITVPGEPPSQPIPFVNEPRLTYEVERVIHRGVRRLLFRGQVDPTSLVLIEGKPQEIDRDGRFSLLLLTPLRPSRLRLAVTVVTPLGREQTYDLELI